MAEPERAAVTAASLKALLVHAFDRDRWEAVVGEHLHVRIGNAPVTLGRAASLDELAAFLARIESFGTLFCEVWERREAIYVETDVAFLGDDGRLAIVPCAIVARVTKGNLVDLRLHLDPSPIPIRRNIPRG